MKYFYFTLKQILIGYFYFYSSILSRYFAQVWSLEVLSVSELAEVFLLFVYFHYRYYL